MQHTIEHRPPERPSIEERAADPATLDATLVLKLGYRGADFCGFGAQPGRRTVAGEVTRSLETLLRREVDLTCAGRTDAGVHAIAQYVSVPVTASELAMPARRLMRCLSALLPDDISPAALYRAPKGFSARFDARSRSYRYRIVAGEARPVLAWDHVWWLRGELDAAAMPMPPSCSWASMTSRASARPPLPRASPRTAASCTATSARSGSAGSVSSASTWWATPSCTRWSAPWPARLWRSVEATGGPRRWQMPWRRATTPGGPSYVPAKGLTFVGVVTIHQELLVPWE